jgi:hypothetical protein
LNLYCAGLLLAGERKSIATTSKASREAKNGC